MGLQEAQQRRLQNRSEARRVILDSVEALLAEGGYRNFSMRKLVERCGYAAPTIYHYFGDKTGLLRELVDARFRVLVGELERVSLGRDPVENARVLGRAFVDFGLRHSTHYGLLYLSHLTSLSPEGRAPDSEVGEQSEAAEEARRILEAPMLEIDALGRLRGIDLETARQAIWALCHGVISLQTSRADLEWSPDLFEQAFDAMLCGLVEPDRATGARARKEKAR
ncbi:MAG: TetR/AcrR family transcriptional regulator [Deltaproteobacteria bacterium]|nr:TetR/AcrR family transcriptional regulator [Deltaproteobacteria bacterium]MBW2417458.1 TetR/AcrR family transcriptional regulator [Deltaproteobacteria bacterium]